MRAVLVFPPSLCLPNPVYYALPMLAGALGRAGHEVRQVDLNVLAADRLLTPEWAERALSEARRSGLIDLIRQNEAHLLFAPEAKAILRHEERNFDPPLFKRAFQSVIEALNFYYLLDPVVSPHREAFGRDVTDHVKRDHWSPLRDLYEEVLLEKVLESDPEFAGLSVCFPEQAAESVRLAAKLKQRKPDLHICLGGPLISLFSEQWLADDWLDAYADSVVIGEGETAIVELVDALEGRGAMENVKNLAGNKGEPCIEKMDLLPLPDFDSIDLSLYLVPRPIYPLQLSRGCCWGKCTFCSTGWREHYRKASAKKIRDDLMNLHRNYGAKYIMLQDSNIPPNGARDLARIVKEEDLSLYWYGTTRFENCFLDADHCRALAEGGCRSLLLGFESVTQRVVDLMCKGFDVNDVPAMLDNLRNAGISAEMLWFIGFPTETCDEALKTARFLHDMQDRYGVSALVGDYQLHPDTEIFKRPAEFGLTITGRNNDTCLYVADQGMQMEEKARIVAIFTSTANRTLVCNGAHLPHLVESGLDLSAIGNPMRLPG